MLSPLIIDIIKHAAGEFSAVDTLTAVCYDRLDTEYE
jgi:hypothetical protein